MQTLIIGGTTKSATTSLYHYLSAHPQILPTHKKECYFWTDPDFNELIPYPHEHNFNYENCFPPVKDEKIRLDVTPNYIYSKGTPIRIKENLRNVQFIFSLREPISRIISWHGFAKQMGILESDVTLKEYVDRMIDQKDSDNYSILQPYRSLIQGKYWKYLEQYTKQFPEKIDIIFFEDLRKSPKKILKQILSSLSLESSFYDNYEFEVFNPTRVISNKQAERNYHKVRKTFARITKGIGPVHKLGVIAKERLIEPTVYAINGGLKKREKTLPKSLEEQLIEYYRKDVIELHKRYELPIEWKEKYDLIH